MQLTVCTVAFKVYDMDRDGFISNGELFLVLKMMVGNNLKDGQLQQIVDKTIMEADLDGDGKINFEEFKAMVANTDIAKQMTLDGEDKTIRVTSMLVYAVSTGYRFVLSVKPSILSCTVPFKSSGGASLSKW